MQICWFISFSPHSHLHPPLTYLLAIARFHSSFPLLISITTAAHVPLHSHSSYFPVNPNINSQSPHKISIPHFGCGRVSWHHLILPVIKSSMSRSRRIYHLPPNIYSQDFAAANESICCAHPATNKFHGLLDNLNGRYALNSFI